MHTTTKTILITGISKGIGNGLATTLQALGHDVIGTTRKPIILKDIPQVFSLDLTDYNSIERLSKKLIADRVSIDMVINNAGIGSDYYKYLSKEENFELRFQTHLFGTFAFTEAILPLIKHGGKIINISSKLASFESIDSIDTAKLSWTKSAYIMSKASLNMYTKILANRLKDQNIEVLSIHPGWVKTSLSQTNVNAPLNIQESVNGILKLLETSKKSGTFWDATTQLELKW